MSRTLASPGETLPGTIDASRPWTLRINADRAALTVLLVAACFAALTFGDFGVTWDEPGLRTYGQMLVAWYRSGFTDDSAFSFANLRYYGGAFDIVATLLEPWTPLDPYASRHLLGALVGLAGLALTWRLARRLGGSGAGLLALLLLATLPGWWGHMFFNSKDVPFAVAMLAALVAWLRCVDEWPRPRLPSALLLGLTVGLTLGIRVGGIMLGLFLAPALILLVQADARRLGWSGAAGATAGAVMRLLPALSVALAVLIPVWPWVALAPGNFFEAIGYLNRFPYTADTIFAGQRYPAPAVPLSYWPTLLAFQLPEMVLAGLVLAGASTASSAWFASAGRDRRTLGLVTVTSAALLPLAYAMLARPTAYNVLRHFIFVLPPLAILAGVGLDRALALVPSGWRLGAGGAGRRRAGAAAGPHRAAPPLRVCLLQRRLRRRRCGCRRGTSWTIGAPRSPSSAGSSRRTWAISGMDWGFSLSLRASAARSRPPQEVLPPSLLPVHHNAPARLAVAIDIFFCVPPPPGSELARVERAGVVLSRAYRTRPDALITSFTNP